MTAVGTGNGYEILDRVLFPHSLGVFYAAVTQYLGFPHYGDEGKVMGLAPYGDPELHMKAMRDVAGPSGDLFTLNLDYFTHDKEGVDMTWDEGSPTIGRIFSDKLVDVFGPLREPGSEIGKHEQDVAASLQNRLEEIYLHLVERLQARTGERALALAGGVALNAVANGRIRPETPFEELYVQPAAGDSGTAVGAAYYVWNQELRRPRGFVMNHAYTGPEYSDSEIARRGRRGGPRGGAARRRRPLPHRRRADRGRRRRRLVPGPDGVRAARARPPLDRRRPAPRRDEGRPQRADQAP